MTPTDDSAPNNTLADVVRDINRLAEDAARVSKVGEDIGELHKQLAAATDAVISAGREASDAVLAGNKQALQETVERSEAATATLTTSSKSVAALVDSADTAFEAARAAAEALQPVVAKVDELGTVQTKFALALDAESKALTGVDERIVELRAAVADAAKSSFDQDKALANLEVQGASLSTLLEERATVISCAIKEVHEAVAVGNVRQQRQTWIIAAGFVIVIALLIVLLVR